MWRVPLRQQMLKTTRQAAMWCKTLASTGLLRRRALTWSKVDEITAYAHDADSAEKSFRAIGGRI